MCVPLCVELIRRHWPGLPLRRGRRALHRFWQPLLRYALCCSRVQRKPSSPRRSYSLWELLKPSGRLLQNRWAFVLLFADEFDNEREERRNAPNSRAARCWPRVVVVQWRGGDNKVLRVGQGWVELERNVHDNMSVLEERRFFADAVNVFHPQKEVAKRWPSLHAGDGQRRPHPGIVLLPRHFRTDNVQQKVDGLDGLRFRRQLHPILRLRRVVSPSPLVLAFRLELEGDREGAGRHIGVCVR